MTARMKVNVGNTPKQVMQYPYNLMGSILWPIRLPQDTLENKRSTQAQEKLRMIHTGLPPTRKHANNLESAVGLSRSQLQAGLPRGPGEQRPPPTHGKIPHQPLGDSYPKKQIQNLTAGRSNARRPQRPMRVVTIASRMETKNEAWP